MKVENFKVTKRIGSFQIYNVTPVPGGDCYLFVDENIAFVYDTGFSFSSKMLANNIKEVLQDRKLDYILITHSHYDHAFGSATLSVYFPGSKVIGSSYAAYVFTRDGAKRTMTRLDNTEAIRQGYEPMTDYIDHLHVDIPVEDKEVLHLGKHTVEILVLPGHTKDCVGYYFREENLFLSCETLGLLASMDVVIPAALVGFRQSMEALERVSQYSFKYYFISHQGLLEFDDIAAFLELSKKSHLLARDLIVSGYKAGVSQDEILQKFLDVFYLDMCRSIYPYAAFVENMNIMIPKILSEEGYI